MRLEVHLKKKDEARTEMEKDAKNPINKHVYSMDVQAVMICPKTKASAGYYKTKLAIHNFTLYNEKTGDGFCNVWDETEADLSANVFATMIIKFIEENVPSQAGDHIILWSDGCPYQNRNATVSNAILDFAMKNRIQIFQKYLEKGHTQMKCDSMHSGIQRKFKDKEFYLPSSILTYCKQAKGSPSYHSKYWNHDEFLDFSKINLYSSIRPGKKKGDPVVADLRALRYDPDGKIYYKVNHSDGEWIPLAQPARKSPIKARAMPRLFTARLPIKKTKWQHLQELKEIMPRDVHSFYDNIPYRFD